MSRAQQVAFGVMLAFFVLAPLVLYPVFLMKVMCFALFACAFNLLVGFGGLLSFGHAMFLGTAGYAAAHSAKVWGFPPEAAILLGTFSAALLGLVTGLLAIRRQGIYFAMITLALAQMIFFFYLQAPFTGGEDGIQSVPRGRLFGFIDLTNLWAMYGTVLAIFVAGFLIIFRAIHSPFGQVLKAIRENEPRAISLGYDTTRYKFLAYLLSGTLAGLAGATKAIVFQLASLTDVHWSMSGEVVLMTMSAPTTGPKTVPMPPSSVMSTTSPDIDQCASVSEASWNTIALVAPATPDSAADSTNAISL